MTKDNNRLGRFQLSGIPPAPRGVPQIEVTFDIDANSILNVSAVEKGSGKTNKIIITNNKDRLSKEDIERMVNDAEKFKDEDSQQRERIQAKNNLESYAFNLKSSLENNNVKEKISESDRTKVCDKCKEVLDWLDNNQTAEKDEFEYQQKELESVAAPVMKNLYASGESANQSAGFTEGPTVEEVD